MKLAKTAVLAASAATGASAQTNLGTGGRPSTAPAAARGRPGGFPA